MGKCKNCGAEIPDDEELCKDCIEKQHKADESYLDNLLNSVSEPVYDERLLKKKEDKEEQSDSGMMEDIENLSTDQEENSEAEDSEDEFDLETDLSEFDNMLNENSDDDILAIDPSEDSEQQEDGNIETITGLENSPLEDGQPEGDADGQYGDVVDELLNNLDESGSIEEAAEEEMVKTAEAENELPEETAADSGNENNDTDEDLLAMLDMISSDEPETEVHNDEATEVTEEMQEEEDEDAVFSLDDLLSGEDDSSEDGNLSESEPEPEDEIKISGTGDDLGDIFSNALEGVSDTDTPKDDESLLELVKDETGEKAEEEVKSKKKPGFFQRIFGNIKNEQTEKEAKQQKEEEEKRQAEREKKKEEKKAKKEMKKGKNKGAANTDAPEGEGGAEAQPEDGKKKEKKKKEKKVKEKKEKKKKEIPEEPEDEGKINKVGASIIFILFAVLTVFIIIGSKSYFYNMSIKNTKQYFSRQNYSKAYEEIAGMKLKKKDQALFEKLEVIMFIQKEINSYESYMGLNRYPDALDSLLKGLGRCDKYLSQAVKLGIDKNVAQLKDTICGTLQSQFGLSEEAADELLTMKNKQDYSQKVYDIATKAFQKN